jgi:hypothetical protein
MSLDYHAITALVYVFVKVLDSSDVGGDFSVEDSCIFKLMLGYTIRHVDGHLRDGLR